jgi:single-stranded-DNA-specific exonuclease
VDVLIRSIRRREPIAVYGDFDADGVTSTALLVQALTSLGADVQPYIPHRVDEGYGLNLNALRKLYGQGVRLVVTVDCGIRAVDEVNQARRGLEFVITDHHTVGPELPFASAVIDPQRKDCSYPFKRLAGVGVAFKLAQALIREAPACRIPVHIEERDLLDLVALGTVADLVPLKGENRALVRQGLEVLNKARREGVRALMNAARLRPGSVVASSIGYGLGPRLNAAGRLGDANLSYQLLVTADRREAEKLAGRLNERNRMRQQMTAQAYELATEMALVEGQDVPLLFAADKGFMAGIVGLVAGRLTETYYRPAVVVEIGEKECKGSCRSIPEFHITRALDECRDLLVRYGGHAAAAGFTVRRDNLEPLKQRLTEIAQHEFSELSESGVELAPKLSIDAVVKLSQMNWELIENLEKLEPCGEENPSPRFLSRGVPVANAQVVGSEGRHLKLQLGAQGQTVDGIAFGMGSHFEELGDVVDVIYALEVNEWNGERRLQLNVQDLRPSAS